MSNHFNTQIGFGTSGLGDSNDTDKWNKDLSAIRHAIDVGYQVIDTAEMYGAGKTETLIGQALDASGKRDNLHIVSKVLPKNALTVQDIISACERSIKRMNCGYIDTYLLHWREGPMPLEQVVDGMLELKSRGLIKNYGISNFNKNGLETWTRIEKSLGVEPGIATHQIRYALTFRGPEKEIIPLNESQGVTTMAWGPLGKGLIFGNHTFVDIAQRYGYVPSQLALAWVMRNPTIIAIPKSVDPLRIEKNFTAQYTKLHDEIVGELNRKFPIPL
jgi:diketogulonate reductase-like aldo/keto reductase